MILHTRPYEIVASNTYGMYPGTLLAINGVIAQVVDVDHGRAAVTVRYQTRLGVWLSRLTRRFS